MSESTSYINGVPGFLGVPFSYENTRSSLGSSNISTVSVNQITLGNTGLTLTAWKTSNYKGGVIHVEGTPTALGTFTGKASFTNSSGNTTHIQISIVIRGAGPTITTGALADATKGAEYSQTVEATGSPTITFSIISGELPPGLTLDPDTGVISGTIE